MTSGPSLPSRLVDLLLELLAIPSTTGEEGPIADWLERRYTATERVQRVGRSLVIGAEDRNRPTVLLVAHTDVVPPTDADRDPYLDGDRIVGRGASDMKGGLAVAMDCFEDPVLRGAPCNLRLVCYAGEEGPHQGNELGIVLHEVPELADADFAVVLEPTDLKVQLGCLGTLHAEVAFVGKAAHSARPWHGENALTKAGGFLAELGDRVPEDVEVDGLLFREVFTATAAWTDGARNVVPARFTVNVNYRFAPGKSVAQAEESVRALVGDRADVTIVDAAPAALPNLGTALVRRFSEAVGGPVEPKQAWTDVARLCEAGVPALNFGPGLTSQAHQAGEHVPAANLAAARDALTRFVAGG